MTLRELFAAVDAARVPLLIALGGVVLLTALIGLLHGRGNGSSCAGARRGGTSMPSWCTRRARPASSPR